MSSGTTRLWAGVILGSISRQKTRWRCVSAPNSIRTLDTMASSDEIFYKIFSSFFMVQIELTREERGEKREEREERELY